MADSSSLRPVVAVRALAFDSKGRLLLLRRANSAYGNGEWCLPGGKLDYGDTLEETVAKEMREETGLAVAETAFLLFQNSLPVEPGKMHCVNFYFTCRCGGEVILNPESSEFAWVTPQDALAFRPVFGAEAAIRKLIG